MKKVMVWGGTGAIGSQICRMLKEEDCQISFTYFDNEEKAREMQKILGCHAVRADLRDPASVEAAIAEAVSHLGNIDALIQTAGTAGRAAFYERLSDSSHSRLAMVTHNDIDEIMTINAKGSFHVCQKVSPHMKSSANPNLVLFGSMDGVKMVPSPVHFAASKAALKGMTEALAKELGKDSIKVNMIAPGILDGGQSEQLSAALKAPYLEHCSLKRFGKVEEIAEVAVWFALENTYITGQSILLDGGL